MTLCKSILYILMDSMGFLVYHLLAVFYTEEFVYTSHNAFLDHELLFFLARTCPSFKQASFKFSVTTGRPHRGCVVVVVALPVGLVALRRVMW